MIHWQTIAGKIVQGEISQDDYTAKLHIPFENPLDPGETIHQVIPLTEAEFIERGGSLFLTFIPDKLIYYSCAYRRNFTPINLYLVERKEGKTSLVDEYSVFFIPRNQTDEGTLRFRNLSSRLNGYVECLSVGEWDQLEPHQETETKSIFSSSPPNIHVNTISRQVGLVGSLKKVTIKLKLNL